MRFTGIVMSMFEEVDPVREDEVRARAVAGGWRGQ